MSSKMALRRSWTTNGLVLSSSPKSSPLLPSSSDSPHERNMSTPLSPSPASAPIPLTKLSNDHNLRNPALSQSKARKSMKSRKSWTPGSGGVNYGTSLSSSGGHTPITCGSPTQRSMPQPLWRNSTSSTLMPHTPPLLPLQLHRATPNIKEALCRSDTYQRDRGAVSCYASSTSSAPPSPSPTTS